MGSSPLLRSLSAVASAILLLAGVPLGAGAAGAAPNSTTIAPTSSAAAVSEDPVHCPQRVSPPPAVDESETVAPGETTPTPLPVPDPPIGGDRLGGCGVISDPAAGALPKKLTSKAWLIADLESGEIIAARDPHGRYRPASTIKILLALIALENLDLNDKVTSTANDWAMEGDACGMGPEGDYTVEDMVTGLLVVSGNDCANALARLLGGYDETLEQMNHKAESLGAMDTRVATPSGLDAAGMSTSAYDLAVIFRAAMANEEFARMIALPTYEFPGYPPRKDIPGDEDHPGYTMGTSNTLLRDEVPGMIPLGGKTGFTDDARKTFVGAMESESDGRKVLIVQLDGLGVAGDSYHQQAVRMLEYGFAAPEGISVGSLENRVNDKPGWIAGPAADSVAMGVLPMILLAAIALSAAALVVLFVRRRRRYRRR